MRVPLFQVDAFASRRFSGNPAAVMALDHYPDDALLQAVAAENNLAETAFLVPDAGNYRLRWFTPRLEVPLCGHATLASAAVVMERLEPGRTAVTFHSASGPLAVTRVNSGYSMDLPSRPTVSVSPPPQLGEALGGTPAVEVVADPFSYTVLLKDEATLRTLEPDFATITRLDRGGLIVTAAGAGPYDFVSRYFAPAKGVPEDPVTGSAHCALVPYWAQRLGKTSFRAYQASRRGGEISCRLAGDRVELSGACVFYLEGQAEI